MPLDVALRQCETEPTERGKIENREVVKLIHQYAAHHSPKLVHLRPGDRFPVGKDRFVSIPELPFFVRDGQPVIVILQPWKEFALDRYQFEIWSTVMVMELCVDDFSGAEIELLDLSRLSESEARTLKVIRRSDLPLISHDELDKRLEIVIAAHDLWSAEAASKESSVKKPGASTSLHEPSLLDRL